MKNKSIFFLFILLIFVFYQSIHSQVNQDSEYKFGSIIPNDVKQFWVNHIPIFKYNSEQFEVVMDWSGQDSPVKNQGSCGSCWAFAAVSLIENIGNIKDLAEQVLISCSSGDCSGGWYGSALYYINSNGIPPEACYPYIAQNGDCDNQSEFPEYLVKVSNYDRWAKWGNPSENTVNDLKSLLQTGPVIVHLRAPTDSSFCEYSGGVYDYEGEEIASNRGHAVLVVGYNDTEHYFKFKNSWGSEWGEGGYMRIAYDDVNDDVKFGGFPVTATGVFVEYLNMELVSIPGTPFGESTVLKDSLYTFFTNGSTSNFTNPLLYQFYWGDGSKSLWSLMKDASHIWYQKGRYGVTVSVRSQQDTTQVVTSDTLLVNVNENTNVDDFDFNQTKHKSFELYQNYPNPFNGETQISFNLSQNMDVSLKIYNSLGEEVALLEDGLLRAGDHRYLWNGRNGFNQEVAGGIYFIKLVNNKEKVFWQNPIKILYLK